MKKKTDGGAARPREQRASVVLSLLLSNFLSLHVGLKVVIYDVGTRANLDKNGFNFYGSV